MSTFRLYFRLLSGHFFLKFSYNKIVMGKKILVSCLAVIMIAFFYFSIRNIVFHCIFLGKKDDRYYIETRHKDLFSHYNPILGIL